MAELGDPDAYHPPGDPERDELDVLRDGGHDLTKLERLSEIAGEPWEWEIRLVKTDGALGPAAIGTVYTARASRARCPTYEEAKVRAFRMLKRDRPTENPMCWTVSA